MSRLCQYCGDPATIVQEIKQTFWPFKVASILSFCRECHQEIVYGKFPRLTDSGLQSRKGSGIQNRKRFFN